MAVWFGQAPLGGAGVNVRAVIAANVSHALTHDHVKSAGAAGYIFSGLSCKVIAGLCYLITTWRCVQALTGCKQSVVNLVG